MGAVCKAFRSPSSGNAVMAAENLTPVTRSTRRIAATEASRQAQLGPFAAGGDDRSSAPRFTAASPFNREVARRPNAQAAYVRLQIFRQSRTLKADASRPARVAIFGRTAKKPQARKTRFSCSLLQISALHVNAAHARRTQNTHGFKPSLRRKVDLNPRLPVSDQPPSHPSHPSSVEHYLPFTMVASTFADTFGIWLIAQFFQAILYGMGILQAYLYFFWYPKDGWWTKGTVITIVVLETVQTGTFFGATYKFFITDFGNLEQLADFPWQALAQLLTLYASTFVAQCYFAHCIYQLHKRQIWYAGMVFILSLVGFGGGVAQIVLAVRIQTFSQLPSTSGASNTQAALSLAADIAITVGLCWRLHETRTGIQSTNKLLNFLIMTAINRGVLTMITALLNMVLFLTQPGTFYFMVMILISGKFYMNSMLAMLNTRQHAHSIGAVAVNTTVDHISMPNFNSRNGNEALNVNISVAREMHNEHPYAGSVNDKVAF
uniref:DUF6534 domain-containing protein n=1 Tax=Mycena chlorophos TaxID=658473 RepID=A0ABQ0MCH5_MYCCL|nr:predicted protein [Mycena chlorophos]